MNNKRLYNVYKDIFENKLISKEKYEIEKVKVFEQKSELYA